jgi:anti-anti-sigma factor
MPILRLGNRSAVAEISFPALRCAAMAARGGATTVHHPRLPGDAAIRVAAVAVSRKGHLMPASPYLATTIRHCGRRSVVRLEGELDASTEDRLRSAIGSALDHSPDLLVVDLSALGFMDCSGLSVLVWAHQRLAEQERQLLITGTQPVIPRLIRLTGLDTYLHFGTQSPTSLLTQACPVWGRCPAGLAWRGAGGAGLAQLRGWLVQFAGLAPSSRIWSRNRLAASMLGWAPNSMMESQKPPAWAAHSSCWGTPPMGMRFTTTR